MTQLDIQGIVFDVDGVLFDTERLTHQTWKAVSREMGWPQVGEAYLEFVGQNRTDIFRKMVELFGEEFPKETFMKVCSAYSQARMEREGVPMKPGVREILAFLKERGVPAALATSTGRPRTERRMEMTGLGPYFSAIITGDQVVHSKPDPEIYLLDEPSSNLDMTSIQELREHLQLIKGQGKTILIAEHRLYYLMDIADRIVYLDRGAIQGIFTPAEFRRLSQDQRERMGLRATDLMDVLPPPGHAPVRGSVLSLNDVSLRYKKRTILHGIGLSAARGEIIGVVGHNGAGKTTFSRALCGLHKDCDGQFQWDGGPMERRERLKQSYMVMQDVNYELFAESVEAECSFGIRNPDRALVDATLEELGLAPYRERHPNTLSGGQKQRVAVAVSMICGKDLLVFDEPTSGLDFDSMAQVAGLIRRLSDMGKVIFIVTHDFEFVCRTCSRVLHFDEGEMPDDVPVIMEALPKLRELFSVSDGKER